MASAFGFLQRNWQGFRRPPTVKKADKVLKFGILGAANIAPNALITPAKSHPEVIIQSIAARDKSKALAYAKKHAIPDVKDSYQAVLDDPDIQCVYIPLPNGLHFEWAVKAIRAGKHVLLEKPSVSNAAEAERLFGMEEVSGSGTGEGEGQGGRLVLLEAFHYRFAPSWRYFMGLVGKEDAEMLSVHVGAWFPKSFPDDDIRFNYELAGGVTMDLGTYLINVMRQVAGEPEECLECEMKKMPPPREKCDYASTARWRMAKGVEAVTEVDFRASLTQLKMPAVTVRYKPFRVEDSSLPEGQTKYRVRSLRLVNYLVSGVYHRIEVEDEFFIEKDDGGEIVKKWKKKETKKAYKPEDVGLEGNGEDFWFSYRHQLEQFVNKVMGRETLAWVSGEDSINQMRALDMVYEKGGLGARPNSKYFAEV